MPVDFSNASRPFQQYQWTLSVVPVDLFITIHFFQFPASSYFIVCVSAAALHVSVSPSQRGAARRHAVRFTSVQTVPQRSLYSHLPGLARDCHPSSSSSPHCGSEHEPRRKYWATSSSVHLDRSLFRLLRNAHFARSLTLKLMRK